MFKEDDKNVSRTPQLLLRLCGIRQRLPLPGLPAARAVRRARRAALRALRRRRRRAAAAQPLGGCRAAPSRAPVYSVGFSAPDAAGAGRLRWLAKQPAYNFVFRDDVANPHDARQPRRTTRRDAGQRRRVAPPAQPPRVVPQGRRRRAAAGRSAGVPTHDAGGRPFGPLTPAVRAHIDEALGEAQQMLLLHRYDRVSFGELFGPAGGGALRALGVHPDVVGYLQRRGRGAREPGGREGRPIGRDRSGLRSVAHSVTGLSFHSQLSCSSCLHRSGRTAWQAPTVDALDAPTKAGSPPPGAGLAARGTNAPRGAAAEARRAASAAAAGAAGDGGRFSRRPGGAAPECRGAAAARPASALQRSRTRRRDLGEVTASLCKDLDGWLGKYQGPGRAGRAAQRVGGAAARGGAGGAARLEERRRAELLLLHVVEERLGLAVSQAQHTRERCSRTCTRCCMRRSAAATRPTRSSRRPSARPPRGARAPSSACWRRHEAEGDADRRAVAAARGAADARDDELRRLRAELLRLREVAEREAAARFETASSSRPTPSGTPRSPSSPPRAPPATRRPPPGEARAAARARTQRCGRRSCG